MIQTFHGLEYYHKYFVDFFVVTLHSNELPASMIKRQNQLSHHVKET